MTLETTVFDPADHIKSPEAQAELVEDAFASGEAGYIAYALGVVARARGMAATASEAGVSRESLYKSLSKDGNPEFATVLKVAHALGFQLRAVPLQTIETCSA